ncbi:MAG: PKD domain-containing protein [Bacteroidota bacterium]
MRRSLLKGVLVLVVGGYSTALFAQVDTEFWFVVPEISHRGSTGGTPGTMRFATLELEATVTIEMPANPGFTPIVLDIPANDEAAVDLTYLIDDVTNPGTTGLENKPLTPDGINPFGLHITSTNMINVYWEVNYMYGADVWTLKGSNGLGTLYYTPFQTEYPNHLTVMPSYSAIDIVASQDNTTLTFTLPDGVGASYGEPMNSIMGATPGVTFTIGPLMKGETFSLFPYLKSGLTTDKLAGTRIESDYPIAVVIKDDNLNTASQGRSSIGDQIVPVNITGDTYVVPAMGNPNLTFVVATQDHTNIYINDPGGVPTLYATLMEGEQVRVQSPNNTIIVISSKNGISAPPGPPIYVYHLALNNMTRASALLPPIGCTGNTQLAFTRARENVREDFYFFLITEDENINDFWIDGAPADPTIISDNPAKWVQLGNGWSAYKSGNIPASKLAIGQHLVENSGGIFHLGILNGFTSANLGDFLYGYFSDYGGLNVGAVVAGTNSSVIRACYGTPVQLHAYGGTTYEWEPQEYLDNPYSNLPFALNLPAGAHEYVAHVRGSCGSGDVPLTVVVAPPVIASFETDVTSGCSPLTVEFEDQSEGASSWQYDLGDGTPLRLYDTITTTTSIGPPPDPFIFSNTYVNHTDSAINFEVTLMVKNSSACADIITKTITVFPEIHSDFEVAPIDACDPLESYFTNNSYGDTATWLWEFGDGGSSTEFEPVHEYRNLFGPDNLQFEASLVAISPYNCRDTSTRMVTVRPYIEASFAYDTVAECSPHEIIITDQSIGADIYSWDFGDGTPVSTSPGPVLSHTYVNTDPVPHTYTISLRVDNEEGCFHEIQREVTVYPGVNADFIPHPPEACSPAEVIFENISTGPVETYLWDFGDGGTSTEIHPIHLYDRNMLRHDTIFTVTLVATSHELCRDTATFDMVIHPYIEAAFTIEDVVGCHPFIVDINNESIGVDTYYWDFGDGTPISHDSSSVLTHTYLNTGDTSVVYPLRLVVFNDEGCSDTMIRNITVHPEITASFTTDGLADCHPLTITFTNLSMNAVNYLWDFGDGAASVEPSPVHTFTNFGTSDTTYLVTLTTSTADGECVKSISWPITVFPQVVAQFTFPNAQGCGPYEVTFENLSIGGSIFTWDFGDGTVITTFDTSPQTHSFVNNDFLTNQEFQVSLLAENASGCTHEAIKTVTVYPGIESDFIASDTIGCHPLNVNFSNQTTGGQTYVWDFGDGSTSNLQDPDHIFTNTGTVDSVFTVKLLSIAPNNICTDSFFMDITVHPYVQANIIIPDHLGCTPFDVVIENSSINASLFRWDFGDGTDTTTSNTNPLVHRYYNTDFSNQQDYEITLVAENFAGCTDEIRWSITVEPDIMVDFTASPPSGCHPLTVDFTNLSSGAAYYNWDFGNGTTSTDIDPSQTFTNIGASDTTYRVWLRGTAGNHICMDSTFIDIVVHPYIMADFTFQEQINCTPSVVQFNNASVGGTSYHWDFDDGTDTTTTDMNPVVHTFNNTSFVNNGVFQVTLTVENADGCTDQIVKTVEVYPAIEALFSMNIDEGCHPLEVDFTNLSSGGYTYAWDFGDGASSEADAPGHTFTNYTTAPVTRQVHLLATSQFNCTSEVTAEITIHPKPTARFETAKIIDCAPFDLPILNTSLNADHYVWNLGNDTTIETSSDAPFNHIFENLTDDIATYELRLLASTDYGCMDSVQQKVYVYPRTIADFSVNDGDCSPFTAHFINESVRGETYLWNFGDGTSLSTTDPINLYFNLSGVDTTYHITLTTTSQYGCVDSVTDTIDVYAQPDAEFISSPTYQMYPSSDVDFTNMTNPGDWSYRWTMGDGFTTNLEDPSTHTYADWGDYEIWLRVSTDHCADSVSHSIRIVPAMPVAQFDTVVPDCAPHTVQFRNNSIYGDSYLWEFGDGTTSTEFEPEHTFNEYGIYNVKLTVTGEGGQEYAYRQVEVYRMPLVDFTVSPELVMLPDDEVRLFNLSKYGDTYLWDFGDGNTSSMENPRHLYGTIGVYDISLDVWTEEGCTDRVVRPAAITVEGEGIIIFPNAFKPDLDGPNGGYFSLSEPEKNNIFHPYWEGVIEYNLEIYTRWGEKLFYSNDVNKGWDGYNKGTLSAQGVYVWKSWGIFINGEFFQKTGDVTLLYHRKQ